MNRKIKTMGTGELAKELGQRKEGKESPSSLAHAWQSKTPVAGTSPLEHTSFHCRAADEFWGGGPCSGAGVIRSAGHTVRAQRTRGRQEMGTTGCRSQMSSFLGLSLPQPVMGSPFLHTHVSCGVWRGEDHRCSVPEMPLSQEECPSCL